MRVHVAERAQKVDPKFFTRSPILIIFYFECHKRINIIANCFERFVQAVTEIHYVSCKYVSHIFKQNTLSMYTVLVKICCFQQGFRNIYFTNTLSFSVPLTFKWQEIHGFSLTFTVVLTLFSLLVGLNGTLLVEVSRLLGVGVSVIFPLTSCPPPDPLTSSPCFSITTFNVKN